MNLRGKLRTLDAINNLGLLMKPKNIGHELKALNDMNNLRLWIPKTSESCG